MFFVDGIIFLECANHPVDFIDDIVKFCRFENMRKLEKFNAFNHS